MCFIFRPGMEPHSEHMNMESRRARSPQRALECTSRRREKDGMELEQQKSTPRGVRKLCENEGLEPGSKASTHQLSIAFLSPLSPLLYPADQFPLSSVHLCVCFFSFLKSLSPLCLSLLSPLHLPPLFSSFVYLPL